MRGRMLSFTTWLVSIVLTLTTTPAAHDWGGTVALVQPSVVRLSYPIPATEKAPERVGVCSGFVISHIDNSSVVMTAHHCLDPKLTANGYPVVVMLAHEEKGVAILRVPLLLRPVLRPNRSHLKQGHPAAAVGFAFSLGDVMSLPGYITHPSIDVHDTGQRMLVTNACFIPGMSGGPIIDYSGRVIGLIESYHPDYCVGFSRPIDDIWELTRPFWHD